MHSAIRHLLRALCMAGLLAGPTARAAEPEKPASPAPALKPEGETQPLALPLDGREGRDLLLRLFRPQPMLRVEEHRLTQAKFPVVDVHTHFRLRLQNDPAKLDEFVKLMDRNRIALCVSLDGELGEVLTDHLKYVSKYPDRFAVFANINWRGEGKENDPATWDCQRPDFVHRVVLQLTDAKKQGVSGLKVFKDFGLELKNADGSLIKIDDERFDPIWEACGELGLPMLIHTADPEAFFLPIDEKNERWEELHRRPQWSFYGPNFPPRAELMAARNRVIERHPKTAFIGAHVANSSEDLKTAAAWLDKYPNLYLDFASRIGELGRQPYSARAFILKYPTRVLFGTDGPWPESRVVLYWRFLETRDEYFPYAENEFPPQGLWRIYGLGLPDDVLQQVYSENAARIVPGVKEKLARYLASQKKE